jgi:signal transduction histidine kinase
MSARDLVAAGLLLVPALLFTEIARQQWIFRRARQPKSRAFRLLPIVTTLLAAHYFGLAIRDLVPGVHPSDPIAMIRTPWHVLYEDPWLVALALLRHLLFLLPLPERRPSARWLVTNYGIALATVGASAFLRLRPGATPDQQAIAHHVFELGFAILGVLCSKQFMRNVRPGTWRAEYAGEMRRPDVILVQSFGIAAFLAVPVVWLAGGGEFAFLAFEVLLGLAIAAPMASRMLGYVVPGVVVTGGLFVAIAMVLAGYAWALPRVDPSLHPLVGLGAVVVALVVFTGGQPLLRTAATRILLGRRDREMQELQQFLHTISPDLGVAECTRLVLAELVRVRRVPGAGILFADGSAIVCGDFDVEPLARVWPHGGEAAALPRGLYGSSEQRDLPEVLRDAVLEAGVGLGVASIDSPRRRWGHLFLRTGYLGGLMREDDADAFAVFLDQLALLLDAADLLVRSIAVERSLAHAEKLAAIGELAARFAHEIRNPVTAARSLAQQLARDPAAPSNAEHAGIILEELERVERQVRDLLRFARREEPALAPVDLSALVRATARDFGARLAASGITTALDTADGVVARADREKVRQVLVNLIENAMDALGNGRAEKHLAVCVARAGAWAFVRVADDGPGIPPDAQARIFDPFVSLKPSGTGLGLAIAKRTIDAHGGTISVASRPGATTFEFRLPLAEGAS